MCEDWHTKMCFLTYFFTYIFLQAIWKCLYKPSSHSGKGTLYQLRNLINWRNVTATPKSSVDACEDFLDTVVDAHIVAAALEILKITSVSDTPSSPVIPENIWLMSNDERRDVLHMTWRNIVNSFVWLDPRPESADSTSEDGVLSYACQLLSLGLLYCEFADSIHYLL